MAEAQSLQVFGYPQEIVQQFASSPAPLRLRMATSNTANAIEIYNASGVLSYAMAGAGTQTQGVSPASGAATTLNTGGTVTPTASIMRTVNGGAVTGVIIAVGTVDGQTFTLTNEGSGSITFAAVATSHVADGVTTVIPVLTARTFIWLANAVQPAWYRTSG